MEKGSEASSEIPRIVQVMYFNGLPRQVTQQPDLEGRWQEFLSELQPSHAARATSLLTEQVPWEDTKAFLSAFEQVAEACRWPQEEWVGRLLPALRGGMELFFCQLNPRERGDYSKVKAAILRADTIRRESKRQHFRQCCYQDLEGPRRVYNQLQELCRQWLKPDRHTKEQILELIIQEQLITMLPAEVQTWVKERGPDDCSELVALAEDFLMGQQHPGTWDWQMQATSSLQAEGTGLNAAQKQLYMGTNQKGNKDISLTASEMRSTRTPPVTLRPPERQEMAGVVLKEEPQDLSDLLKLRERPVDWEIIPESDGSSTSRSSSPLEPFHLPTPEMSSQLQRQGTSFPQKTEHSKSFLGSKLLSEIKTENSDDNLKTKDSYESSAERFPGADSMSPEPPTLSPQGNQGKTENNSLLLQLTRSPRSASLSPEIYQASPAVNLRPRQPQKENASLSQYGTKTLKVVLTKFTNLRNGRKHTCPECGHTSENLSEIIRHRRIHTKEGPYECAECGKTTSASNPCQHHKGSICQQNKLVPDAALEESQRMNRAGIEDSQPKIKTEEEPIEISLAGVSSRDPTSSKHHKTSPSPGRAAMAKAEKQQKKHHCPLCAYQARTVWELHQHRRIHSGEKPYICPDCGKTFGWAVSVKKHRIKQHGCDPSVFNAPSVPQVPVAECDVTLSDDEELINAMTKAPWREGSKLVKRYARKIPGGMSKDPQGSTPLQRNAPPVKKSRYSVLERKHECPECGHRAYYLSDLLRHMKTHKIDGPFKCPECGRSFARVASLKYHRTRIHKRKTAKKAQSHQGERKFICSKCGHRSRKLSTHLMHMKVHREDQPFKCDECGDTFSFSSGLSRHKRIHKSIIVTGVRKPSLPKHQQMTRGDLEPSKTTREKSPLKERSDTTPAVTHRDDSKMVLVLEQRSLCKEQQVKQQAEKDDASAEGAAAESAKSGFADGTTTEGVKSGSTEGAAAEGVKSGSTKEVNLAEKEAAVRARLEKFMYSKGAETNRSQPERNPSPAAQVREKPDYLCSECGKSFSSEQDFTDHQNTHTAESLYECDKCEQRFPCKTELLHHQMTHVEKKPYNCAECGEDFIWKESFLAHQKTHNFESSMCLDMGSAGEEVAKPEETGLQTDAVGGTEDISEKDNVGGQNTQE